MPYLLISLIAAIAAAIFLYVETGSLLLAALAYVGAGFSVMIVALIIPAMAMRQRQPELNRT